MIFFANQPLTNGPDKKTPTTSTTIANKPKLSVKPSTPQDTTGSPSSKPASSPSRHYHSRLPRKIPSRDASIESSQSHDCDTASIGTEESDYLDGERLYRGDSFPVDQYDADRSDLESSTRSWQCAPDILTGTREIHTRSVEVQVEPDEDQTVEDIQHKYLQLERLLHGMKKDCHDLELAVADRDSNLLSSVILIVALCKKVGI
ncbi:hypothetical protein QZH41_006715 [Actinostola sp. cb2023]|nr:hypothetical protein QZH41_006715 [Actinostola sp. cb2023]